jgi:hypothetical protein
MIAVKVFLMTSLGFLSVGILLALKPCCKLPPQLEDGPLSPAYARRGHVVQEHYEHYNKRLETYSQLLSGALKRDAPELLLLLEAPGPLRHGYQILPRIIADASATVHHPRAEAAYYSWPWTDELIERARAEIEGAHEELNSTAELDTSAKKNVYASLAHGYQQIRQQQQNIDAHIQYNRFWQATIAGDRLYYDRETVLHNQVLQRQAILDVFHARAMAVSKAAIDPSLAAGLNEITTGLNEREKFLAGQIDLVVAHLSASEFVRLEQTAPGVWVAYVPVYTDIDDSDFVQSVTSQIENIWQWRDSDAEFRVKLAVSYVPVSEFYLHRDPPQAGSRLDIHEHLAVFPSGGAILTTGALTTHVQGRAIVLGPHDITPRVLAHEFGHILGFRDVYFRGYADLGEDGFQVMEVVADPDDIMGAPATGPVLRKHFDALRDTVGNPTTGIDQKKNPAGI